ncbi:hypothetical protein C8T65DRAFT_647292 [Cerioporus squamosus]|nr:hypothetical protein C8T65DRAFT_647292 [Cerioporus squamosus]
MYFPASETFFRLSTGPAHPRKHSILNLRMAVAAILATLSRRAPRGLSRFSNHPLRVSSISASRPSPRPPPSYPFSHVIMKAGLMYMYRTPMEVTDIVLPGIRDHSHRHHGTIWPSPGRLLCGVYAPDMPPMSCLRSALAGVWTARPLSLHIAPHPSSLSSRLSRSVVWPLAIHILTFSTQ